MLPGVFLFMADNYAKKMLAKEIVNAMMAKILKNPDTNAKFGLSADESENFTKLCMAFTCPTGTEDIRLLVSSLPDGLLKHIALMTNNHKIPEPAKKLAKITVASFMSVLDLRY